MDNFQYDILTKYLHTAFIMLMDGWLVTPK